MTNVLLEKKAVEIIRIALALNTALQILAEAEAER